MTPSRRRDPDSSESPVSSRRVFLHVGLPKTGTTYLQRALWLNRERLADQGVFVPGDSPVFHQRAARDLLGRRAREAGEEKLVGSWQQLVDQVTEAAAPSTVVSEEFLVYVRPRQARAIERAFRPAELNIVITVRDLGRVLGSAWQHELTKGHTSTWPDFVRAIQAPDQGGVRVGVGFWMRYDVRRVLETWEALLPPERIHVVIVPPAGAGQGVLLERFCVATDLDPGPLKPPDREVNISLGAVEAEALRRLNVALAGRLNERQYVRAVRGAVLPALAGRTSTPRIQLTDEVADWAAEVSAPWVDYLHSKPFHVVGDVEELTTRAPASSATENADQECGASAALEEATVTALAAAVEDLATLWWRVRRRQPENEVTASTRFSSSVRSWGYRARVRALALADRNRLLGRAAAAYVRRGSRSD